MTYDIPKRINAFFRPAVKSDIKHLTPDELMLTDRQGKIFDMRYKQKEGIGFIADALFCSRATVDKELRIIRSKIVKCLD